MPHKDAESIIVDSINNTYAADESFDDLDEGFVLTDESNNVIVVYIEDELPRLKIRFPSIRRGFRSAPDYRLTAIHKALSQWDYLYICAFSS